MTTLRFTKPSLSATVLLSQEVKVDLSGGLSGRKFAVVFRIDGRRLAEEGYRVDRCGMMGWEAIDGGAAKAPRTLREAKALADRYLEAIQAQSTLSPNL